MRVSALVLFLAIPSGAGAVCIDWAAMGKFADIEAATVVFEGAVTHIERGDVESCAPERVLFTVERVWKGEPVSEYTLLQANGGRLTERLADGTMTNRGCPTQAESDRFTTLGERYIVFAVGVPDRLGAMGCGTSKTPTTRERRRLDKWRAKQK